MRTETSLRIAATFIESYLREPMTAQMVSHQVPISEYHFYRLFKKETGLSVKAYIIKRKLSEGLTTYVKQPRKMTLEMVALTMGFASHDSYTRAFKRAFGQTPTAYIRETKPYAEPFRAHNFWCGSTEDLTTLVTPLVLPALKIVGQTIRSSMYQDRNFNDVSTITEIVLNKHRQMPLKQAQKQQKQEQKQEEKQRQKQQIGLVYNVSFDANNQDNVTFDYFRGLLAEEPLRLGQAFSIMKIPSMKYLCIETISKPEDYTNTLNFMIGTYFHQSQIVRLREPIELLEWFHEDRLRPDGYIPVSLFFPVDEET